MTAKILKPNGNTRYVSTYRALTDDEKSNEYVLQQMKSFELQIKESLGPSATMEDLGEEFEAETPTFEPYEDKENKPVIIPDRDEFQSFDQYIGAEVLLPVGDKMKTGKVKF